MTRDSDTKIIIYNWDIGMEFGTEKGAMLIIESVTRQIAQIIELLNQESIRSHEEKEKLYVLGIIRSRLHKTKGDERKIRKGKRSKEERDSFFETKLCRKNLN